MFRVAVFPLSSPFSIVHNIVNQAWCVQLEMNNPVDKIRVGEDENDIRSRSDSNQQGVDIVGRSPGSARQEIQIGTRVY